MENNLKEKIRDVIFWICAGGAIYLIVAFLMKTDWLSCPKKLNELYEIIRDTLTLMAYFLAPAAAIVLFSDWRKEHIEKSRESQGKEIYDLIYQLDYELTNLRYESDDEEYFSKEGRKKVERKQFEIQHNIYRLDKLVFDFDYEDDDAKKFKELCEDAQNTFQSMHAYLSLMFNTLFKMNNPAEYVGVYINETTEQFVERMERQYEEEFANYLIDFGKIYALKKDIKVMKDTLKVKDKSPN